MILLDYNGITLSNLFAQKIDVAEDLMRHMILNSIRSYRKRYFRKYGEIVICYDAGGNWRKKFYPQYKANRKTGRQKDDLDWGKIFDCMNQIRSELKENFPYKVVGLRDCEADDVIATLVETTQEFGQYEEVMIVSADKDFAQLQKYPNVHQYSYITKKEIREEHPYRFLQEQIFRGQTKDGVPNVLTGDNVLVEGTRQNRLSSSKIELWKNAANVKDVMLEEEYRNYLRNKKMLDLSEIPEELTGEIIRIYDEQDQTKNKMRVLSYLIEKRCRLLLENVGDFI